jgi:hypothetical protein
MKLFLCRELTEGTPRRETDEEMTVEILTWSEALATSRDGTICDAKSMIGLWYWEWRCNGGGPATSAL